MKKEFNAIGMTAKEWKDKNPTLDGNMRDYANILQLVILSKLQDSKEIKKIEMLGENDNAKLLN